MVKQSPKPKKTYIELSLFVFSFIFSVLILIIIYGVFTVIATTYANNKIEQNLDSSMHLLANWMMSNQTAEGNFVYQFDTSTGTIVKDDSIVRQALASYSLSLYYKYTGSLTAKESLKRSYAFFQKNSEKVSSTLDGKTLITQRVRYKESVFNNASAFVLLSLINYTEVDKENKEFLSYARDLANYLVGTQIESGAFMYQENPAIDDPYNNGESFYALSRMYVLENNPSYINSARKAALHFIDIYKDTIDLGFYSWGNQGFYYLYKIEPDQKYWSFIKTSQNLFFTKVGNDYQDYFEKQGSIAPRDLEVYIEGLNYVADLSRNKKDPSYPRLKKFVDDSLIYIQSQQINGPLSKRKSNFANLNGALCFDYYCKIVRVDSSAHDLTALVFYLDNFEYGK